MSNAKFTTVLLDADDTVYDFHRAEKLALNKTLATLNIKWTEQLNDVYLDENLKIWKEYEKNEITKEELKIKRFERFFDRTGLKVEMPMEKVNEIYIYNLSQCGFLFDGAYEFVQKLTNHADVYLATNGLKIAQRGRVKHSGLDKLVNGVFISEEMGCNKPSKEYFNYIFNQLHITDKSKVLIVGDSLTSDMQGGKNAGITTCLYDPHNKVTSHSLCDYIVRGYDEILRLVVGKQ